MDPLFDPDRTDAEIVTELASMDFAKLAQGSAAHVFGDSANRIVLKVFPPLTVGTAKELAFVKRNPVLRGIDRLTLRWGHLRIVDCARRMAKSCVAALLSRRNAEKRETACKACVQGYEVCINRGLMTRFPTRAIPNCMRQLTVRGHGRAMRYLAMPPKIVMQERFSEGQLAMNVLRRACLERGTLGECLELVDKLVRYQVMMWQCGLADADLSFNVFGNSLLLPDGTVQLHDANHVTESFRVAQWFVKEKEKDLRDVFARMIRGEYPRVLYDTSLASIAETARKLYRVLPVDRRDPVVMYFLELCRRTLSEDVLRRNWASVSPWSNRIAERRSATLLSLPERAAGESGSGLRNGHDPRPE